MTTLPCDAGVTALTARVSPTSMSASLASTSIVTVVLRSVPALSLAATGASFTLSTFSASTELAPAPALSVAVTRICTEPTSALAGVPLNVWVAASKLSHVGKGLPSASVALRCSESPASTSVKLAAGTV